MSKRLYRSRSERVFAGVCGGLATYVGIDPSFVRIATVLLAILSFGTTLLVYLIMAVVVPLEP